MSAPQTPVLSVVVAIVSDTIGTRRRAASLGDCLEALSTQIGPPPFEVIVPHLPDVEGIASVQARFPWVTFLRVSDVAAPMGGREHHDVLRARGLATARGELVGLLEDHARPDRRWCANVVAAHRGPHAAIGGAMENGVDRRLNWAVYYCDFGKYQNPVPAGKTAFASDANVTYKRAALEQVRSSWQDSFREVVVNGALLSLGETVALDPTVVVYQNRQRLTLGSAVRERFVWGRSYAATRRALLTLPQRLIHAALSPVLPFVLLLRMSKTASERRSLGPFAKAFPHIALLVTTWSVGEGVGYLTGVPGERKKSPSPIKTPVR